MSAIRTYKAAVTTTGAAGSATGTATTETMIGLLLDIYLDYDAAAPATTDTTIAYANQGGNILVTTNLKTDSLIAPRQKTVDNTNTAITDSNTMFALNGQVTITLAQADALDPALTVYFRVLAP